MMIYASRGGLMVVVGEHWAHTPLSRLNRTTAVGAGKAAAAERERAREVGEQAARQPHFTCSCTETTPAGETASLPTSTQVDLI